MNDRLPRRAWLRRLTRLAWLGAGSLGTLTYLSLGGAGQALGMLAAAFEPGPPATSQPAPLPAQATPTPGAPTTIRLQPVAAPGAAHPGPRPVVSGAS